MQTLNSSTAVLQNPQLMTSPHANLHYQDFYPRASISMGAHLITLKPWFDGHPGTPGLRILCRQQCSAFGQVIQRPDLFGRQAVSRL